MPQKEHTYVRKASLEDCWRNCNGDCGGVEDHPARSELELWPSVRKAILALSDAGRFDL